jgi:hypothetical protein
MSKQSFESILMVNVYGTCDGIEWENFVTRLYHLNISDDFHWLLVSDFNFYHYPANHL